MVRANKKAAFYTMATTVSTSLAALVDYVSSTVGNVSSIVALLDNVSTTVDGVSTTVGNVSSTVDYVSTNVSPFDNVSATVDTVSAIVALFDNVSTNMAFFDNVSATLAGGEAVPSLPSDVKTVVVTLGVIFNLLGVVGNVSILCVIAINKTLRKPYNALLGSMAVNDIVRCGVLNMIQVAGVYLEEFPLTWPSQTLMCRIHGILWTQLVLMTILHIMVIAIHRYLIIYHQKLSERITNRRTIGLLIGILHIVSFALLGARLNPNNSFRFVRSYGRCIGKLPGQLNLVIISTITFLTIVVLLLSYISVYHKVSSSKKQLQQVSIEGAVYGNQKRRLQKLTQHQKILLCMGVIVILLIVSFIPGFLSTWMASRHSDISPSTVSIAMTIVWIVGVMNSVVYGAFDSRFRKGFKRLILCNNKVSPMGS